MKTIGLLGGMSWESTAGYYRAINEGVKTALGGLHSARLILYSVDFAQIEKKMQAGDWEGILQELIEAAKSIQTAGADFILICTNTIHKIAPRLEAAVDIPLIHIADATGEVLRGKGLRRVGVLGTVVTMEHDFYKDRLTGKYGLEVLIPDAAARKRVDDIIFNELCLGKMTLEAKNFFINIIGQLGDDGAEAVILGCTELGMLIQQADVSIPLFDTTAIHAEKAVVEALKA